MDDGLRSEDIYLIGPGSAEGLNLKTHLHLECRMETARSGQDIPCLSPVGLYHSAAGIRPREMTVR